MLQQRVILVPSYTGDNIDVVLSHNEHHRHHAGVVFIIRKNMRREDPVYWLKEAEKHGTWTPCRPGKRKAVMDFTVTRFRKRPASSSQPAILAATSSMLGVTMDISNILNKRNSDIIARFDGEEFNILAVGADTGGAKTKQALKGRSSGLIDFVISWLLRWSKRVVPLTATDQYTDTITVILLCRYSMCLIFH